MTNFYLLHPADRLVQGHDPDLHQIVERRARPYRDFLGGVRLVEPKVQVEGHLADARLPLELDVDEVGLPAVGLPVRVRRAVAQLVDAVARLRRRERPDGLLADLPPTGVGPEVRRAGARRAVDLGRHACVFWREPCLGCCSLSNALAGPRQTFRFRQTAAAPAGAATARGESYKIKCFFPPRAFEHRCGRWFNDCWQVQWVELYLTLVLPR